MDETLTIDFSEADAAVLQAFKAQVAPSPVQRQAVVMPALQSGTKKQRETVEKALESGEKLPSDATYRLPPEIIEGAKATFIASGGNISEVAALYDLNPEAVLSLAVSEQWPVYGGGTKAVESRGKAQLMQLRDKLWRRIEFVLDSLEIEKKAKASITQHRLGSEYVEPLASRNATFKTLMDQYMRVQTLLEPEVFADDPDGSNFNARKAREEQFPGGIEGVNREIADFLSEVVVGVADKMKQRELAGYGQIIDVEVESA